MKIFNNKIFFIKSITPLLLLTFSFVLCSEKIPMVLDEKSSKEIVSFILKAENNKSLAEDIAGTINDSFIELTVPYGTDLTILKPDIEIRGSSVSPDSGETVDLSSGSYTYTVTASDLTKKDYSVVVNINASSDKKITSFKFYKDTPANSVLINDDYICNITDPDSNNPSGTITVIVPNPNDPSILEYYLTPSIEFIGKSISPEGGDQVDFWFSSYGPVKYTVTAEDNSSVDYNVSVDHTRNSYKDISEFKLYSNAARTTEITCPDCTVEIDNVLNEIEIKVPYNLSGTVYPQLTASGVQSISPSPDDPIVLVPSGCTYPPVQYTITAQDTSTVTYTINFSGLNGDNAITDFRFTPLGVIGTVNNQNSTVTATVPNGTSLTSLTPTIAVSSGATISPTSGTARNFSGSVTYTVTSQSGQNRIWTVTITVAPATACDITGFVFKKSDNPALSTSASDVYGIVSGTTINCYIIPYGTVISSLKPTISISGGATILPASGTFQNFTSPVTYVVTAQDTVTKKTYTVNVTVCERMEVLLPDYDNVKNIPNPSGSHYAALDDMPGSPTVDSDTVYNDEMYGANKNDIYRVKDSVNYGNGTVKKIIVYYRVKKAGEQQSLDGKAWPSIRVNSNLVDGPTTTLSTWDTWYSVSYTWTSPPQGGSWTWDQVNALEIGITLGNYWNWLLWPFDLHTIVYCSQIYAEVYYEISHP